MLHAAKLLSVSKMQPGMANSNMIGGLSITASSQDMTHSSSKRAK